MAINTNKKKFKIWIEAYARMEREEERPFIRNKTRWICIHKLLQFSITCMYFKFPSKSMKNCQSFCFLSFSLKFYALHLGKPKLAFFPISLVASFMDISIKRYFPQSLSLGWNACHHHKMRMKWFLHVKQSFHTNNGTCGFFFNLLIM